jgi:hypothetical protein
MLIVFVHGWSVTDTQTYGRLPEALAVQAEEHQLTLDIKHIWLGRYISFHDDVTVMDLARAFHCALREQLPDEDGEIAEFSCVTHSTGGPVLREWLERYYGAARLSQSPLRHLVMLAPANHGSALAALGKKRVGRIKAWFSGVEPGQRILDWLALGSQQQFDLAQSYLDYKPSVSGFFPFVLTGQAIDKKLYDFVNSYLVEAGSDGVVRVAGANLNYSILRLVESERRETILHGPNEMEVQLLEIKGEIERPCVVPFGVVPGTSHSGKDKGIMRSVLSPKGKNKRQVQEILKCLRVQTEADYRCRADELHEMTRETQKRGHRYVSLVLRVVDDHHEPIHDFDLFLLGGDQHSPDQLAKGFFVDRQRNASQPNHLVYYLNYDLLIKKKLTGFRVLARPAAGFVFYQAVEFRSEELELNALLRPNETLYVELQLRRCIDKQVFRLDKASDQKLRKKGLFKKSETRHSFKNTEPSGKYLPSKES